VHQIPVDFRHSSLVVQAAAVSRVFSLSEITRDDSIGCIRRSKTQAMVVYCVVGSKNIQCGNVPVNMQLYCSLEFCTEVCIFPPGMVLRGYHVSCNGCTWFSRDLLAAAETRLRAGRKFSSWIQVSAAKFQELCR
jgi:hypothetical protein